MVCLRVDAVTWGVFTAWDEVSSALTFGRTDRPFSTEASECLMSSDLAFETSLCAEPSLGSCNLAPNGFPAPRPSWKAWLWFICKPVFTCEAFGSRAYCKTKFNITFVLMYNLSFSWRLFRCIVDAKNAPSLCKEDFMYTATPIFKVWKLSCKEILSGRCRSCL